MSRECSCTIARSREQTLTAEEQVQLQVWYQQQNAAQAQQLNQVFMAAGISDRKAQVEMALTQLAAAIQRVWQIAAEKLVQ